MIKIQILTTPLLNTIKTFDAEEPSEIKFDVIGGNQVVANNLVIKRVSDGVEVYNFTQETFNLRHVLPARTLINGVNYRAEIRTRDINNNWSPYSVGVLFWCYSEPNVHIETIDYNNQNRVYNQTVLFQTSYSQTEAESMQSYRYILYNSNRDLLKSFSEKYAEGLSSPLTQEIAGLENGTLYYLEVKTLSPSGNVGSSGLVSFRPFYTAPRLTVAVTPKALTEEGAIKVSANIVQIIMKLYDNKGREINPMGVEYISNEYLDLNREDYVRLVAEEGFNTLESDFILKVWIKNIPKEEIILSLFNNIGKIDLFQKGNRIMAYKTINNLDIKDYYCSNSFNASPEQNILIQVIQEGNMLDLKVEPI